MKELKHILKGGEIETGNGNVAKARAKAGGKWRLKRLMVKRKEASSE